MNNAGNWKDGVKATPVDGPDAYGAAMFVGDVEGGWQESMSFTHRTIFPQPKF